jgi:hypothetical protein
METGRKPLAELWLRQCQTDLATLKDARGNALQSLNSLERPRKRKRVMSITMKYTHPHLKPFREWLVSMQKELLDPAPHLEKRPQYTDIATLSKWNKCLEGYRKTAQDTAGHVGLMIE